MRRYCQRNRSAGSSIRKTAEFYQLIDGLFDDLTWYQIATGGIVGPDGGRPPDNVEERSMTCAGRMFRIVDVEFLCGNERMCRSDAVTFG